MPHALPLDLVPSVVPATVDSLEMALLAVVSTSCFFLSFFSFFLMFDGCFPTKLSIFARVEGTTVQPEIPPPVLTTALAVTPAPATLDIPELVRFALVRLS